MKKIVIPIVLILLLILLFSFSEKIYNDNIPKVENKVGEKQVETIKENNDPKTQYKDHVILDKDSKSMKISDIKDNKPMIINYFATWCPPCKNELPYFNKAYNQYKDKVNFLIIDLIDDSSETIDNGIKFFKDNNYDLPLYFDYNSMGYSLYNRQYIPITVFVDRDGNIVHLQQGSLTERALVELINKLIGDTKSENKV